MLDYRDALFNLNSKSYSSYMPKIFIECILIYERNVHRTLSQSGAEKNFFPFNLTDGHK